MGRLKAAGFSRVVSVGGNRRGPRGRIRITKISFPNRPAAEAGVQSLSGFAGFSVGAAGRKTWGIVTPTVVVPGTAIPSNQGIWNDPSRARKGLTEKAWRSQGGVDLLNRRPDGRAVHPHLLRRVDVNRPGQHGSGDRRRHGPASVAIRARQDVTETATDGRRCNSCRPVARRSHFP